MLEIKDLSYKYGLRKELVLDKFSLSVDKPGIYGLLGPNGAGKSTLLYLISGALTPVNGSVTFGGYNTRRRLPGVLSNIMLVPEEISMPSVRLDRFVELFGPLYPNFDRDMMYRCLDEFEMREGNPNLRALSMGQKKKVFISFALACRTPLLLMDEPTNGIDIQGKAVFRRLLATHCGEDNVVIISTHQVRDLDQLLDRIIIMTRRRVLLDTDVTTLQKALRFERNVDVAAAATALHSLPSIGGADAVFVNTDPEADYTDVNLELLFDYALKNSDSLGSVIKGASLTPNAETSK